MLRTRTLSLGMLLSAVIAGSASAEGDAAHGKTLFSSRCTLCHAVTATTQNKAGPPLAGVFGRQAGTVPSFRYSKALTAYGKTWDDEALDTYLAAPGKAVPGSTMAVTVPSAPDRADIIAYLKTLGAQ